LGHKEIERLEREREEAQKEKNEKGGIETSLPC